MSVETTFAAVESLIAEHVAASFKEKESPAPEPSTAGQIRSRITDHFEPGDLGSDQDNSPSAALALYNRLFSEFSLEPTASSPQDRTLRLDLLHQRLIELRRGAEASARANPHPNPIELLFERQQLALKNEFTEGFGQAETWFVSTAAVVLVLLDVIDILWALPILALSIGRSWHLDRQCKKRIARIAEIEAAVGLSGSQAS